MALETLVRQMREHERVLQTVLDNMPAMIGCWGSDLRNRFGNHAYREWFGIDPAAMRGMHIRDVIGEERFALNLPYIEAVLRGEPQIFERAIPSPDGTAVRHALAHYLPDWQDGEVRGFYVLVNDISELKEIERQLRETKERYQAVLEAQTEAISRLAADGTYLYVNPVYCRFFGKTPEELLGQRWYPVAHPDDLQRVELSLATLSPENPVVTVENRVHSASGAVHWMQFVNRGFFAADGQLCEIQSVGRDVTERRQVELALQEANERLEQRVLARTAELKQMAVEMTRAEERERRAIARDLHDDLGQLLHVARLKFDALARLCKDGERLALCRQLDIFLADASSRVRSLTGQLAPPVLDQFGLLPALYWLAAEMGEAYELDVRISAGGATCQRVEPLQASILFRCVRELLINVARHAAVGIARVELVETVAALEIVVEDHGRGCEPDALVSADARFGLSSIRERMHYMDGSLSVDSAPGRGMRARLRLPLEEECE